MQIIVYKAVDGRSQVLIRPPLGRHIPLVLLQGLTRGELGPAVQAELDKIGLLTGPTKVALF